MCIINKMLQELDRRHAAPGPEAVAPPAGVAQQARAVKAAHFGSNLFWRLMAAAMVFVVGWVMWVMWQITPRPVVTELALQSAAPVAGKAAAHAPPSSVSPPVVATGPESQGVQPPPGSAVQAGAPAQPASEAGSAQSAPTPSPPGKIDMLRLATEIATPVAGRGAKAGLPPPQKGTADEAKAAGGARPAERTAEARSRALVATADPSAAARAEATPSRSRPPAAAPESGSIDKRVDTTQRERAESEFRRSMVHINQGRMAEGMDGLRTALAVDPGYEAARQTLVALLLEARRTDEASSLLQEGLAVNPANTGFAMLQARIYVERGDAAGALALLLKQDAAAKGNAEYQAFVAALYQRLGRHAEAIERYQAAVRLSPGVGAWWVGLGISLDATSQTDSALESFRRARSAGSLNAELLAFVDRRLRQAR